MSLHLLLQYLFDSSIKFTLQLIKVNKALTQIEGVSEREKKDRERFKKLCLCVCLRKKERERERERERKKNKQNKIDCNAFAA